MQDLKSQTYIHNNDWEVLSPTGWQDFEGVVITHNSETIVISGLECTKNHLVKIDGQFVCADSLPHIKSNNKTDVFDLVNVSNGHEYITNDIVSHNCLYIDEMGFIQNNLAEEFFTSVYPTIIASEESKIILTSTPNGYNLFHKFWSEAEKGVNGFTPVRVDWQEMPGRTQAWYDKQVEALGELKASQELSCLGGNSTVSIIEDNKKLTMNLETLYHKYKYYDNEIEEDEQILYVPNRMVNP